MAYPYYPQNLPQNYPQQRPSNGVLSVPNESYIANYPVAPGDCVTFKIEGQPIIIEKSMGFSQFETPRIEKYRLVKEEVTQQAEQPAVDYNAEFEKMWNEINTLKEKLTPRKKKEVIADDAE